MKIGFIDYYLDEPHSKDYFNLLPELSDGKLEVVCGYGEIPAPKTGMDSAAWCEERGIVCCATPEEVVAISEGIIVLAPDHSDKHEELAEAALKSGKPVFVDKTFAPDLAAAERMFALAAEHGTPLCTFSALRYAEEIAHVDYDGILSVACWGGGPVDTYSIHQLEPLVSFIKAPGKQVLLTAYDKWYTLLIKFADGRRGSITSSNKFGKFAHLIQWDGRSEKIDVLDGKKYFRNSITQICKFMLSGKAPFDKKETLWTMALLTAAINAQKTPDVWVEVPEISLS